MGHLVHALYELEGADVFLFLERYPHPFWPSVFQQPVALDAFPSHSRELLSYFQDQHTKRWPTVRGYWTAADDAGQEAYAPLAFLEWAATRSKQSCVGDKWTFLDNDEHFFRRVLAEIDAKREVFDAPTSPYVSVVLPKGLPKHWKFPAGPQSKYKWDAARQRIAEMPATPLRTPIKRRSSVKKASMTPVR
ncbi:Aste57867_17743 [Aphanomyces stellatus]|uniref:Aste57867_17743 protein n=1 Tax=Aphanomyces stellatus TaxID=120398 RepID=A0A485L8D1_9STRA|nr:hypothetical protein As57867_017682 [Aphanomyces stellatus]VFT94489.1 Aste57867_17743 [Aphanomyces stellatus]